MRSAFAFLALLAVAIVSGCGSGGTKGATSNSDTPNSSPALTTADQVHEHAAWTILVYLDADNDLESAGLSNFNQMEAIGSTRDVHVLIQIDRTQGYDNSNDNWTDTRRYLVTRDSDVSTIHSVRMDSPALGEKDMSDWRTLRDFVQWGIQQSPSDNYCLVVWDHGSGWAIRQQSVMPRYKYVVVDQSSGSAMNVTEIPNALDGTGISVLAFDACLMQQLEVAYELKDSARYMVASAATEPSPGYNYYAWISRATASTSPADLCKILVQQYAAAYPPPWTTITQCAVDLSRIGDVATATGALASVLMQHPDNAYALVNARGATLDYSAADSGADRHCLDLLDYASRSSKVIGTDAGSANALLQETMKRAIVAETHSSELTAAHGLAIYLPPPGAFDHRYSTLRLAEDTSWDEWLLAQ